MHFWHPAAGFLVNGVQRTSTQILSDGVWVLQDFNRFLKGLLSFAGVSVPAAIINAGLKYM